MKKSVFGRYDIDIDKLVRQLIPHWLRGKTLVLFLQACMHPLQSLSDNFKAWADKTRIEASMTSQIIMLEWYLSKMFDGHSFKVINYKAYDNAIYHREEMSSAKVAMPCYLMDDEKTSSDTTPVYHITEENLGGGVSFVVRAPMALKSKIIDIARIIDKYKIVNKTYKIEFV